MRISIDDRTGKRANLALIVLAQVLALALWFSGTAAGPAMAREAPLPPGFLAWLTGGVQLGFVLGTLASAALALPDRLDPRRLIAAASLLGAAANALILALPVGSPGVIALRVVTGAGAGLHLSRGDEAGDGLGDPGGCRAGGGHAGRRADARLGLAASGQRLRRGRTGG